MQKCFFVVDIFVLQISPIVLQNVLYLSSKNGCPLVFFFKGGEKINLKSEIEHIFVLIASCPSRMLVCPPNWRTLYGCPIRRTLQNPRRTLFSWPESEICALCLCLVSIPGFVILLVSAVCSPAHVNGGPRSQVLAGEARE